MIQPSQDVGDDPPARVFLNCVYLGDLSRFVIGPFLFNWPVYLDGNDPLQVKEPTFYLGSPASGNAGGVQLVWFEIHPSEKSRSAIGSRQHFLTGISTGP